jgi:hypothetical protein
MQLPSAERDKLMAFASSNRMYCLPVVADALFYLFIILFYFIDFLFF